MKIRELVQEAEYSVDNPFGSIKQLNLEFKELASQFDITLVAGMGWPNIVKDGGWYGGGLGSKGGNNKKQDDLSLPVEQRRKGFLKALSKMLEKLMADGRTVKIAAGAERSTHQENAVAGSVYDQLSKHAIIHKPPGTRDREARPCIAWFVGLPKELAGTSVFRVVSRFYGADTFDGSRKKSLFINMGGNLDAAVARKLNTAFKKFSEYAHSSRTDPFVVARQKAWAAFVKDLAPFCAKVSGEELPPGFIGDTSNGVYLDLKILSKDAIRLNTEQMTELVAIFNKHMK